MFYTGCKSLLVVHLRAALIALYLKLALKAIYDDLEVQLSHTTG